MSITGSAVGQSEVNQARGDLNQAGRDQYFAGNDLSVTNWMEQPLPRTPYEVRTSLPPDLRTFTGRDRHLKAVAALLERGSNGWGSVVTIQGGVQAIDGMPGVGKTALAVHMAHRVKDRFPDRQLFMDLHAHTAGSPPITSFDALGQLRPNWRPGWCWRRPGGEGTRKAGRGHRRSDDAAS